MKKMKLWSLALLAAMMLLPHTVMADDSGTCGENLTWTYSEANNTLTIEGTGKMNNYDSNEVPWYLQRNYIKKIIIGPGVTSIGSFAFYGCSSANYLYLSNSVTTINTGAFWGCTGLTSITIPNSVTTIGTSAFRICTGLTSITIPNSVTAIGEYNQEIKGETNVEIIPVIA